MLGTIPRPNRNVRFVRINPLYSDCSFIPFSEKKFSNLTNFQSPSKMKITDYFPPSSPPVLLPEVPLPPSASPAKSAQLPPPPPVADCDQASDRSEGDSGKENEEEPRCELTSGSSGRGKDSKAAGGASKNKNFHKKADHCYLEEIYRLT